ncbi:hypothetical protein [Actinokineospora sp.]|uniref:hypothetical protein n=1 Tax=Actinokineospora sp. TaxID=1872133 RepID=UPI004037D97B
MDGLTPNDAAQRFESLWQGRCPAAAPDQIQRPGFNCLCDVLRLPDSFAAVVVDAGHLSPDAEIAAAVVGQLRSTGARLLTVRATPTADLHPPQFSDGVVPEWWQ